MKLPALFVGAGVFLGLAHNAPAGLMDNLQGYYRFATQTNGLVTNSARAYGYAGFSGDSATLHTPVAGVGSILYPPWTNNTVSPSAVRAGNGALSCQSNTAADYAGTTDYPIYNIQADWTISVWFKPNTGGTGLFGTANRMFVLETAGTTYPISFGLRGQTASGTNPVDTNGNGLCVFEFYTEYESTAGQYVDYFVPTNQVDEWHHLVIDYDAEDTSLGTNLYGMMRGYVDGELACELAPTNYFIQYDGFNFGTYRAASGRWWNGQIDEVAMWEELLSTNQILSLYEAGSNSQTLASLIDSGGEASQLTNELVAYWNFDGAFTPSNNWVVTNQAIAVGGVPTTDTGPANLTMYGGEYGADTIQIYPLTNNLAPWLAGSGALIGNGSNDYATIGGNPVNPQLDLTVSAWIYPNTGGTGLFGTSTRYYVFETSSGTTSSAYYPISMGIRGTNATDINGNPLCDFEYYNLFTDGTVAPREVLVPASQTDQWHFVVQIFRVISGSSQTNIGPYTNSMECWLDGVLMTNLITTKTNSSVSHLTSFNVGTFREMNGRFWNGYIGEVAFWQRALFTNEIVELYTNGQAGLTSLTFAPPHILSFAATNSPAGSYNLSWNGLIGQPYGVQGSSDLINWSPAFLTGYTATSATPVITIASHAAAGAVVDPGLTNAPQRFYRVRIEQ